MSTFLRGALRIVLGLAAMFVATLLVQSEAPVPAVFGGLIALALVVAVCLSWLSSVAPRSASTVAHPSLDEALSSLRRAANSAWPDLTLTPSECQVVIAEIERLQATVDAVRSDWLIVARDQADLKRKLDELHVEYHRLWLSRSGVRPAGVLP